VFKLKQLKYLVSASFLSLILGLFALYYELRANKINLVADVVAESNVLDVRTAVKDLSVLFQGKDIQQDNSNLKIIAVRLVNEGETNILENYFDSRIPWGLQIENGRLIEARVTGSNSRYLTENIHLVVTNTNEVLFDKVIFDKGKYVALDLLVLHNKTKEPQVKVVGKIAGMDEVPVRLSLKDQNQQTFLSAVFLGAAPVQIARTIAYSFIGLSAIVVVGLFIAGLVKLFSFKKRARRKAARSLPKAGSIEEEKKRRVLLDIFVEDGIEGLRNAQKLLSNPQVLRKRLARTSMPTPPASASLAEIHIWERQAAHHGPPYLVYGYPSYIEPLLANGLVRFDNNQRVRGWTRLPA